MIITFCGHSDFKEEKGIKEKLLKILEEEINGKQVDFYLGGYGAFDSFARRVCKEYQERHCNAKLYFVTPYIDPSYLKNREHLKFYYDGIISMNTGNVPKRLSILRRNYEMVKASDLVIAYVEFDFGGAYQTLKYAKQMKKRIINLKINNTLLF